MQIDPKFMFWLGLAGTLLGVMANGISSLKFIPPDYAADVAQINGLLLNVVTAVMTFLAGFSSNKTGVLVQKDPSNTIPKVCVALLAGLFVVMMMGQAHAAGPKFPDPLNLTHQNEAKELPSPDKLWEKITTASLDDLNYAAALATAAGTNGAKVRLQCINALIDVNKQARGDNLPKNADGTPMAKPDPSLVTHMEITAEVIDALSPTGPLFTSCSGAAGLLRMQVLQVINAIVTGAAGAAVLGPAVGLP